MPTFVSLMRFTQKGLEAIKDGPARLEAAREADRAAGAQLREVCPARRLLALLLATQQRASPPRGRPHRPTATLQNLCVVGTPYKMEGRKQPSAPRDWSFPGTDDALPGRGSSSCNIACVKDGSLREK